MAFIRDLWAACYMFCIGSARGSEISSTPAVHFSFALTHSTPTVPFQFQFQSLPVQSRAVRVVQDRIELQVELIAVTVTVTVTKEMLAQPDTRL